MAASRVSGAAIRFLETQLKVSKAAREKAGERKRGELGAIIRRSNQSGLNHCTRKAVTN
jgi:hypothetical protein